MKGRIWSLTATTLLALSLLGAACGGDSDGGRDGGGTGTGPVMPSPAGTSTGDGGGGGDGEGSGSGIPLLELPAIGERIVKDASLDLEVVRGAFDRSFQRAVSIAGTHGGFVASSTAEASDDARARRSGSLVLRVPAPAFEETLGELKTLGTVHAERLSGEDVTSQFVDLEARLRNWEAQEEVLLRLMGETDTIQESITVQRNLQDVQLAIEQIRGRLRVLEDQTAMSTITVSMIEEGAPVAPPPPVDDGGIPNLSEAWDLALSGFVAVVATVVISLGYLLPIAILAGLVWMVVRRARSRAARAAIPPAPLL